ncbi:MAG: diaminopimelate epimerase [bacterium]|nr:diaminopimelate epimerase [bacterium]
MINFEKYSVLGNDFIIIDDRGGNLPDKPGGMISTLCRRRFSIGADGVIIIKTGTEDFVAEYYNSDGFPGNMCGNGARAVIDYGYRFGLSKDRTEFRVWNEKYHGIVDDNNIGVELTIFSEKIDECTFSREGTSYTGYFCNTGVPHLIIFDADLFKEPQIDFAREIRHDRVFYPEGTNVNFVNAADSNNIDIRTYERGVEDFTYACGTGAMAAAYTALNRGLAEFPVNVRSHGGTIEIKEGGSNNSMWLWSEVDRVFSGTVEYDQ